LNYGRVALTEHLLLKTSATQ